MTAEIISSFLEVTATIEFSDVLLSFESTEVMTKPSTSLKTNTLSLEGSLSTFSIPIFPFSSYKSLGPTEQQKSDYMTTEIEVLSTSISFMTLGFTVNSVLINGDTFSTMITSTRNNLTISSASVSDINSKISLQDGSTQSRDLYSASSENVLYTTQMLYTSLFNPALIDIKTSEVQTDPFSDTLPASLTDAQTLNTIYLQSSLNSFMSVVSQDLSVDTLSLTIESSLPHSVLPVGSSTTFQIYSSSHPLPVSQTDSVLVNTSTVSPFTSSFIEQNFSSVDSFSLVQMFSISSFLYTSSLDRSQSVNTPSGQIVSITNLSFISRTVGPFDVSASHVLPSSESSPINSFISSSDIFTFEQTDLYAHKSLTSMVVQLLHLSSDNRDTFPSHMSSYSHLLKLTSTSVFYQPELFPTSSVNQFTQSDSLFEMFTLTRSNPSATQSSYDIQVNDDLSSDSFETIMYVDTSSFRQTRQSLHLSSYSAIQYVNSSTHEHPFKTSIVSTVVQNISASLDTSFTNLEVTSYLSKYSQVTDLSFGTSSVSVKLAKVVRSSTFHELSSLTSLMVLKVSSYTGFSKIINHQVISDMYSTQSSETSYVFSTQPTSPPSQAPELSFIEAQITIVSCSIAAVILVVLVPVMVMKYHGKLLRAKRLNEKYMYSEKDGLSSYGFPQSFIPSNKGKNIPLRYHNSCYSDLSYSPDYYVDFEKNWNNLRC